MTETPDNRATDPAEPRSQPTGAAQPDDATPRPAPEPASAPAPQQPPAAPGDPAAEATAPLSPRPEPLSPPDGWPAHGQQQPRPDGFAAQPAQNPQPVQPAAPYWGHGPTAPGPAAGAPPNWASPATTVLPAYGGPEPGAAAPAKRSGLGRAVLGAAVIAALIGGGVGAGVTHALDGNSTTTTSSLTGSSSSAHSNGLNTQSPNATDVTAVAAKILPAVVTISVAGSDGSGDEGSGIIISQDGQILTNNHVVAAAAASGATMTVTFSSGKITPAKIVGRDVSSDLAVIQASGVSALTVAPLGDSSSLAVGQPVVAIGAPLGLSNTVTTGIVSALNRPVTPASDSNSAPTTQSVLDAIQTDAAINPGNSGGPLLNMSGQVIGINSAIATASSGGLGGSSSNGSIGLGFAIPINQAKPIAEELIRSGKASHSLLGVQVGDPDSTATQAGAVVKSVTAGGPADKAGIKVGDVVTKVDEQQIGNSDSLVAAVRSYQPGTTVTMTYVRGGQSMTAQVTLTAAPAS